MIGFFKLFLSLFVIASHANFYFQIPGFSWFNQGISAVIPFFIISGYFTTLVLDKKYNTKKIPLPSPFNSSRHLLLVARNFFISRFKKIAPQYYFYAGLAFIFILLTQPQNININFTGLIANLSIIGLNLHQYFKLSLFSNSYYDGILPPIWYLAALFQYYLIAPFIHKFKILKNILWLISGITFILALFNFIPNNFYTYRFLGNFIFFLTGDLIYQALNKSRHSELVSKSRQNFKLVSCYLLLVAFSILTILQFSTKQIYQLDTNAPLLFGFLFFAPITFLLLKKYCSDRSRPVTNFVHKIDDYLSKLSFSIYLNHYVFIYIFNYLKMINILPISNNFLRFALVTFSSVIFAIFTQFLLKMIKENQTK